MNNLTKTEGMNPSGVEMIHTPISFRNLRADEVELRPAEVRNGKTTLLAYQDARCGMNILDEAVGPFGWQKEYYEAKGLLMCRIGIRNPATGEWLWKSDTGSESNIEADKGLASDAFKRAAVSWGIGRELYSAPRITVSLTENDMFNGKLCQSFKVKEMSVANGMITSLLIIDKWGNERFKWGENPQESSAETSNTPLPNVPALDSNLMWTDESEKQPINLVQATLPPLDNMAQLDSWYNARSDYDTNVQRFYSFYKNRIEAGTWKGKMDVERLFSQWCAKKAA